MKTKPIYKNGRTWYVLLEDTTIAGMKVPAGFVSDGVLVCLGFRWLINNHIILRPTNT